MYAPSERFEIVKKLNPDAVICCGISDVFDRMLQAAGIRLICGIAGDVQQVAEAFLVQPPRCPLLPDARI